MILRPSTGDDDILMLYTGGTTGMPKGVMWRQADLYAGFSSTTIHDPDEYDDYPDYERAREYSG